MKLYNNEIDLSKHYIGTVISGNKDTRELDVHIPELMIGISTTDSNKYTTNINTTNLINPTVLNLNTSITKVNSFKVYSRNITDRLPKAGSKVIIIFIDNNINLGYWEEFNPDDSLEYIETESSNTILKLYIGDKLIELEKGDSLYIDLPSDINASYASKDNQHIISLGVKEDNTNELLNKIQTMETNIKYMNTSYLNKVSEEIKQLIISTISSDIEVKLDALRLRISEDVLKASSPLEADAMKEITVKKITDIRAVDDSVNQIESIYSNKLSGDINLDITYENYDYLRSYPDLKRLLVTYTDSIISTTTNEEIANIVSEYDRVFTKEKNLKIYNGSDVILDNTYDLLTNVDITQEIRDSIEQDIAISPTDNPSLRSTNALLGFYTDKELTKPYYGGEYIDDIKIETDLELHGSYYKLTSVTAVADNSDTIVMFTEECNKETLDRLTVSYDVTINGRETFNNLTISELDGIKMFKIAKSIDDITSVTLQATLIDGQQIRFVHKSTVK